MLLHSSLHRIAAGTPILLDRENLEIILTRATFLSILYIDEVEPPECLISVARGLAREGESLGMLDLIAYVDGGSRGNPGPAGVGVVIDGAESGRITITKWIGHQDNNVAEYLALLEALQCAVNLKARKLHVYSDSQVVVRQMLGAYNCRSERLYSLNWICRKLARSLEFTISHIRRESNVEANGLATAAARKVLPATP